MALANVQMHLESAFHKFFREPSAGFPRFKSKKSSRKSYTTNVVNGNIFLKGKYLKLPKMSAVRMKLHRPISEKWKLKSVTVSREPSGNYFASLLFYCENQTAEKRPAEKFIGIDFSMQAIIGPNGCGKSTTLKALARIWPYSNLSVRLLAVRLCVKEVSSVK